MCVCFGLRLWLRFWFQSRIQLVAAQTRIVRRAESPPSIAIANLHMYSLELIAQPAISSLISAVVLIEIVV